MGTKLQNLLDFNIEQLEEAVKDMGQPKFRTKQLWEWLYKGADFSDMTNLPESFRTTLSEKYRAGRLGIKAKLKLSPKLKNKLNRYEKRLIKSMILSGKARTKSLLLNEKT